MPAGAALAGAGFAGSAGGGEGARGLRPCGLPQRGQLLTSAGI